jgi:uncharacterized protein (DUF1684 family)
MTDSLIELADYRRLVSEIYARTRDSQTSPEDRWRRFCADRDKLFRTHPQTSLSPGQASEFTRLRYYPYNQDLRFKLPIEQAIDDNLIHEDLQEDGLTRMKRIGHITFTISDQLVSLTLFWFLGYGGGLFLPFQDSTNGKETYAGGRYLLDTIKGADLGIEANQIIIDFNFAYNPSCAYNSRWHCPLAPPENRLSVPINAGELSFP